MQEIAKIIKLVLAHTTATTVKEKQSRIKYALGTEIVDEAQQRVQALLSQYVLYPELELALLLSSIPESVQV